MHVIVSLLLLFLFLSLFFCQKALDKRQNCCLYYDPVVSTTRTITRSTNRSLWEAIQRIWYVSYNMIHKGRTANPFKNKHVIRLYSQFRTASFSLDQRHCKHQNKIGIAVTGNTLRRSIRSSMVVITVVYLLAW